GSLAKRSRYSAKERTRRPFWKRFSTLSATARISAATLVLSLSKSAMKRAYHHVDFLGSLSAAPHAAVSRWLCGSRKMRRGPSPVPLPRPALPTKWPEAAIDEEHLVPTRRFAAS